jgi:hypothetical membrane protein
MRPPSKFLFQKIGAVAGIAAPAVGFSCILAAIASYPDFSWTNNALSDLGVVHGVTGPLFNFGLVTAGVLAFLFAALGLFNYFGDRLVGKVGAESFEAAMVALIGIGIFNENFQGTHYILSVAFFVLAPISLFILTCTFWLSRQRGMAVFTVLVGVAAALPWLLLFAFNYVPNVAIPETISGLAVSAWTIIVASKMLKTQNS